MFKPRPKMAICTKNSRPSRSTQMLTFAQRFVILETCLAVSIGHFGSVGCAGDGHLALITLIRPAVGAQVALGCEIEQFIAAVTHTNFCAGAWVKVKLPAPLHRSAVRAFKLGHASWHDRLPCVLARKAERLTLPVLPCLVGPLAEIDADDVAHVM